MEDFKELLLIIQFICILNLYESYIKVNKKMLTWSVVLHRYLFRAHCAIKFSEILLLYVI